MLDDDIGVTKFDKMRKVTFSTGLPRGTCATFNYEGQRWEALPQKKLAEISAVQTRVLGALSRVHDDLVAWINAHPEDTARIIHMMGRTSAAKQLIREKNQAWTWIDGGFNGEGSTSTATGPEEEQAADGQGRDQ